jgi:DNA helicase-2/ATP-dependent DNA helicase PcrA
MINTEKLSWVEIENPEAQYVRPSQLTIITMHKAKGLDWDYVFLPFLHADVIPGSLYVPAGARFLGSYTLAEVARAQIRAKLHDIAIPAAAQAWQEAEYLKTAEEFRLLYVAITRAKRLLWLSAEEKAPFRWNIFNSQGNASLQPKKPCPVIPALKERFPQAVVASF